MKILPDYLIEVMPALEEAMEELRLSVIDNAYELFKCLDVDELSSDTIRKKLELYELKVDNMVEEWLPNGKFYRLYPSIRHNRTRLNSLKSVVCSGGQFEGLWSNEFIKNAEYNYNKIRTLRHYTVESEYDGYFYVSGNISRTIVHGQDLVEDSTLTALSTDILLGQAMPAGYTYLYVPWPRPSYPADAGYFYNVNMLNADRLHYAIDCNSIVDVDYNTDVPASTNYDWVNGTNTPYRTPYWFDYHYTGDMRHEDHNLNLDVNGQIINPGKWKVHEHGSYVNYDDEGNPVPTSPQNAHFYVLDDKCNILNSSDAIFATPCYIRSSNRTTNPNQSQIFVPKRFEDDNEDTIFTIDCNNIDDITKENKTDNVKELYGPYRWDHLFDKGIQIIQEMSHIKTYKPIWSESSPVFAMMQSNFNSGLHPTEIAQHSFYNWFELKQQNNILLPENSTIENNEPPISEITHTSFDRPTYGRINNLYVAYTRGDASQGSNTSISASTGSNVLFDLGDTVYTEYDCELQYYVVSLNSDDDSTYTENVLSYIEGDPISKRMYLNLNSDSHTSLNYITYRTSNVHKLWFSSDKQPVQLDSNVNLLYNDKGSSEIYLIQDLTKDIEFSIIGFYDENNNLISYNSDTVLKLCYVDHEHLDRFGICSNALYEDDENETLYKSPKYVLFKTKLIPLINPPIPPEPPTPVGAQYGVMGAIQDSNIGMIETGSVGQMTLIHGDLIDCGVGEYGVITQL